MQHLTLYVRQQPIHILLHTSIAVSSELGILEGGFGFGGAAEAVLANPIAARGGLGIDGTLALGVTDYVCVLGDVGVGGTANAVMADFIQVAGTGFGIGGSTASILTKQRLMSEADDVLLSELDDMLVLNIERIILE